MNEAQKQALLQQIAAIPTMERGKLCTYEFKERRGVSGPYYKLQHWQEGKNKTRYVSAQEVPQLQEALEGYEQFLRLTQQYAELVIQETREGMRASKKKNPRQGFSSHKRRKSRD